MDKYLLNPTVVLLCVILYFHVGHSTPIMDKSHPVPEDVTRFHNFLDEFDRDEVRLVPTIQLITGEFPLAFKFNHNHPHHHIQTSNRLKRDVGDLESTELGLSEQKQQRPRDDEDDINVKSYVRNEINRIFNCYQRLRCGYTRAQAEEDCQWLENSSLYHQIMKMLGIKNYPKKTTKPTTAQGPPSHAHTHSTTRTTKNARSVATRTTTAQNSSPPIQQQLNVDVAINPIHQNLQNGIRYGGVRPGSYLNVPIIPNKNRRYYDSFFTNQELSPISTQATKTKLTATPSDES